MKVFISAIIGYLLGSVSFSIILSRLLFGKDVRKRGSGNAGATNMARNFGKTAGILTLAGDMLKAALALTVGHHLAGDGGMAAAGLFCLLGHCYPAFYGFKGGKGVAVGAIIVLAAGWKIFACCAAAFFVTALLSKKVSLGSIFACLAAIAAALVFTENNSVQGMVVLAASIIVVKHSANISRLKRGKESNFRCAQDEKMSLHDSRNREE